VEVGGFEPPFKLV